MDTRSIKTRAKIKDKYILMLLHKEPVNVRALVKKAKINKSTFYRYYSYIEELEDEIIHDLAVETYNICKTNENGLFIENFFDYYENKMDDIRKFIFNWNISKSSHILASLATDDYKTANDDLHRELLMYILANGCISLFLNKKYPREDKKKAIIDIGRAYFELIDGKR